MHVDKLGLILGLPFDTGVPEVADEFLLLRIDRDERNATLARVLRLRVDVLELRVAIGMLRALDGLLRRLEAVAQLAEQLADGLVADSNAVAVKELARQDDGALRRPAEGRFRVAPRGRIDELLQRRQQLWMHILVATTAATLAPNLHKVVRLGARPQFVAPLLHRVRCEAGRAGHRENASVTDGIGLGTRPQASHALIHRAPQGLELLSDERLVGHEERRSRSRDLVDREVDQLAHSRALRMGRLPRRRSRWDPQR